MLLNVIKRDTPANILSHEYIHGQGIHRDLKARSNMHIATFVFKYIFKEYFVKTSHNYSTRRNSLFILVSKVSTETAKKSFYYFGAQVFSNLLSSMKGTESLLIFIAMNKGFFSGSS